MDIKKQSNQSIQNTKLLLEEMEARQLFSGGIEGIIATEIAPATATYLDIDSAQNTSSDLDATTTESAAELQTQEIVFVDSGVEDYQTLVDDLLNNADANRNIEVVVLDSEKDGIKQISSALEDREDLDAIHIISHGSDGNVQLGNTSLNEDTLTENYLEIALWTNACSEQGDILIYGCNLAESEVGKGSASSLRGQGARDPGPDRADPPPAGSPLLAARPANEVRSFLALRKSANKLFLGDPGPTADELQQLLSVAVRVPDHRKMAPWRFVTFQGEARQDFGKALAHIAGRKDGAEARDVVEASGLPLRAPTVVAVISAPVDDGTMFSAAALPRR